MTRDTFLFLRLIELEEAFEEGIITEAEFNAWSSDPQN